MLKEHTNLAKHLSCQVSWANPQRLSSLPEEYAHATVSHELGLPFAANSEPKMKTPFFILW